MYWVSRQTRVCSRRTWVRRVSPSGRSGVHALGEFVGRRILAIYLIAESPGKYARMVTIPSNHFLQLLKSVLHDFRIRIVLHAFEGVGPPRWHFGLDENTVPIAVVQNALV